MSQLNDLPVKLPCHFYVMKARAIGCRDWMKAFFNRIKAKHHDPWLEISGCLVTILTETMEGGSACTNSSC